MLLLHDTHFICPFCRKDSNTDGRFRFTCPAPVHLEAGRASIDMRRLPTPSSADIVVCLDCHTTASMSWFAPLVVQQQLQQAVATRCIGVISTWLLLRSGSRRQTSPPMTVNESIAAAQDALDASDPMAHLHGAGPA